MVYLIWMVLSCFNPRTHEGCDISLLVYHVTHKRFNPRTHEGCDTIGTDAPF